MSPYQLQRAKEIEEELDQIASQLSQWARTAPGKLPLILQDVPQVALDAFREAHVQALTSRQQELTVEMAQL